MDDEGSEGKPKRPRVVVVQLVGHPSLILGLNTKYGDGNQYAQPCTVRHNFRSGRRYPRYKPAILG